MEPFVKSGNIYPISNFVQDELLHDTIIVKDFSKIKLFFLSNLLEEKGINILLNVIEKLHSQGIFFEVKIAGALIDSNPLPKLNTLKDVYYLGVVEGNTKKELLLWGNVFCLPTYFSMEGQPISIIEAMAFDNFIVTTQHAGIPDICSHNNALFCDIKSEESLFSILTFLHQNWQSISPLGVKNGMYARERFTEERFIQSIINVM